MATVGELMHRGLVTCPPSATLAEAAALLYEHRIHALVVADNERRPLGLLSDTDLLAGEWLAADEGSLETMRRMTAEELMSRPVETIEADAPAAEAAERLHSEHLGRLVVVEEGEAVGVIAVSDVVRAVARPPGERRTVADAMSRGFLACRPDTPAHALARAMVERRSRSAVVLDPRGGTLGVVTGHDLLRLVGRDADLRADELVRKPFTIGPDATLQEAADALLRHEVHRLLVVDRDDPPGVPLGILSTADVLAEMAAPGSAWRSSR